MPMWYRTVVAARNGVYVSKLNLPISETLHAILEDLRSQGFKALVVGGAVRDAVMGVVPKDIDIEVYGVDFSQLAQILNRYGHVLGGAADAGEGEQDDYEPIVPDPDVPEHLRDKNKYHGGLKDKLGVGWMFNPNPKPQSQPVIGKAFGVIKFRDNEGNDYDFSLPRRDSKTGTGHTGFEVTVDHTMTPEQAAARRDFTMNALAYDPLTAEVHDYYGGVEDLENGVLRATTEAFKEDPLRVLRGMQFAARYGLRLDPDTAKMCREVVDSHNELATERIAEEWMKLAIKGKHPGTALEYLADTGWLKHYPELEAMFGVPQDPEWHPEGWEHFDAPDHKRNLYTADDKNVSHWQDVTGFTGGAPSGSRYVVPPYRSANPDRQHENSPEPHIYVTMDVPVHNYSRYVWEQDRMSADPIATLAVRHLVMQYGGAELNDKKHHRPGIIPMSPVVYSHAEKQGDYVELTVGLNSELSEELLNRGCPTHVYVKMGDVATHTAHVMDAAAAVAEREGLKGDDRATLVLAAMVHDVAKPQTTEIQHRSGRGMSVTSIGHEKAGEPIAVDLLKRMGIKKSIRDKVGPLVARHLAHVTTKPTRSNVRKLAHEIAPATIEELARLIEADHSGRPPLPQELPRQAVEMLDIARKDGVSNGKPTQIIQGKHVLPYYGGASGKHIGTAVQDAYKAYLSGAYHDFDGGQQWLSNYLQPRASMLRGADVIELGVQPGPMVGQILSEAWRAQMAGVFTNREDALAWLSRRVGSDATSEQ